MGVMLSAGHCPPWRGSVAAQRQGADPFVDVSSAPADAASADVDRMGKPAFLDAPPDGRAATDASEAHHLLARQQFILGHYILRGDERSSQGPDWPVAEVPFATTDSEGKVSHKPVRWPLQGGTKPCDK